LAVHVKDFQEHTVVLLYVYTLEPG
jgi:hypothetical protein